MIGTGIAAHTAFLAFGAARLFPNLYSRSPALYGIPWIAPSVIGFVAIALLRRHYRRNLRALEPSDDAAAQRPEPASVPTAR